MLFSYCIYSVSLFNFVLSYFETDANGRAEIEKPLDTLGTQSEATKNFTRHSGWRKLSARNRRGVGQRGVCVCVCVGGGGGGGGKAKGW